MKVGERISELRNENNITQQELADRLYVSRDLVSKWERGERRPDYKMLVLIADIFSVDIEFLSEQDEILLSEISGCIPEKCEMSFEELQNHLNSFLKTLNEKERNIFIRRYYFYEKPSEIAERYFLKENHIRTVLSRARKKLYKYLSEVSV